MFEVGCFLLLGFVRFFLWLVGVCLRCTCLLFVFDRCLFMVLFVVWCSLLFVVVCRYLCVGCLLLLVVLGCCCRSLSLL